MYVALTYGRRFRTFNVVDYFNREALAIEIDLNLPAQYIIRVLERIYWSGISAEAQDGQRPEIYLTCSGRMGRKICGGTRIY